MLVFYQQCFLLHMYQMLRPRKNVAATFIWYVAIKLISVVITSLFIQLNSQLDCSRNVKTYIKIYIKMLHFNVNFNASFHISRTI